MHDFPDAKTAFCLWHMRGILARRRARRKVFRQNAAIVADSLSAGCSRRKAMPGAGMFGERQAPASIPEDGKAGGCFRIGGTGLVWAVGFRRVKT